MYIPNVDRLREEIMEEAYVTPYTMHLGTIKMYQTLKAYYWWPSLKKDVAKYVSKCLTCQQIKVKHQTPAGKLWSLLIPEWKWERVSMDFVCELLKTPRKNDMLWVVMDRLTKSVHFLSIRQGDRLNKLAKLYIEQIVRLHGVPLSIVLDRDL